MTSKLIKKLVLSSYTKNKLDDKKVFKIAGSLKRSELKQYIKGIKNSENSRTVTILTPQSPIREDFLKRVKNMFPDKQIVVKKDDSLIAGIKIIDNDTIYDFNMQNMLENLVSYINA